jgi:hypothetical protein
VTPELKVRTEPRGKTARQVLDELLAPHGLEARDGPAGVIKIVRADAAPTRPKERRPDNPGQTNGRAGDDTGRVPPALKGHTEHVTVTRPRPYRHDRGVASEITLDSRDLAQWRGGLSDDPLRTVHTLPRVSVPDDFHAEFTVRGSPPRHVGVVVDGVATPWLQHTTYARGATGSLTMLSSEVLDDATLRAGAYPHRFGDRIGAELDITLREGSRDRFALRGSIGGMNGTVLAEGPLGRSGERARGSWLAAIRQSYLEWPAIRAPSTRTAFGFSDGVAKLVYDVRSNHRVNVTLLGGTSNVDGEETGSIAPGDGMNRTLLANVVWRSTFGSSTVLTERVALVKHSFLNKEASGADGSRGTNDDVVLSADLSRPMFHGLLEAGARVGRSASTLTMPESVDASSRRRSGYAHFAWAASPSLTLSPGVRVTDSTLLRRPAVTSWILAGYAVGPRWTVNVSAGVARQPPELQQLLIAGDSAIEITDDRRSRPERATHVDVAVEHRIGPAVRWQATIFSRAEADIARDRDPYPRAVSDSGLSGSARGIELLVQRQSASGLSGWAAYSYGRTRYRDEDRQETFWADFDQRHVLNLSGAYRFSDRTSAAATFRVASGLPIPAYLEVRNGSLVAGAWRNRVRLPPYGRLDARVNRSFESFGRHATIFVEAVNVLNRTNLGVAHGSIQPTGEAVGFTDRLMPRRVSAGLIVTF